MLTRRFALVILTIFIFLVYRYKCHLTHTLKSMHYRSFTGWFWWKNLWRVLLQPFGRQKNEFVRLWSHQQYFGIFWCNRGCLFYLPLSKDTFKNFSLVLFIVMAGRSVKMHHNLGILFNQPRKLEFPVHFPLNCVFCTSNLVKIQLRFWHFLAFVFQNVQRMLLLPLIAITYCLSWIYTNQDPFAG